VKEKMAGSLLKMPTKENLDSLFKPKSVAIIGASANKEKIGNVIVRNVLDCGFKGEIFPINPKSKLIENLKVYPSVTELPYSPDLVIISLPAPQVPQALEESGKKGAKSAIVVSAGFKEVGLEGLELEKALIDISKKYQINLLGPNCIGVIDTYTPLNATFSGVFPNKGNIAFISQSGAMLLAILDWSSEVGIGFSKVISIGNKAYLGENEFLETLADDPETKVIACYLEDVVNGQEFLEIAAKVTQKKPVVIYKSGASQAGARAASSHTGALAGSDLAYDLAFDKVGIIRAASMNNLFDIAVAFANLPLPEKNRVAVLTNAGGPGIITTDNIEKSGLQMARFEKETIDRLKSSLPEASNVYNPVDILGDGGPERYRFALEEVLKDPNVDSAVVLACPTAGIVANIKETGVSIAEARKAKGDKPVLGVMMGGAKMEEGANILRSNKIPSFTFPEPAVTSIKGLYQYSYYKQRKAHAEPLKIDNNIDQKAVKAVFYDVLRDNRLVLLGSEASEVAKAYGIPVAPVFLAANEEEAVGIAQEIGYPVVLKVASPKIMHKTDVGGVKVGLKSAKEVKEAYRSIIENVSLLLPDVSIHGIEVQKMVPPGKEVIIGMSRDVQFGPMIAFGMGGIYVNLLKDVAFRLAWGINMDDIEEMITQTKVYTLLKGYRGEKPADLNALKSVIARVAKLSLDFPEITELDINPLFVYDSGVSALDVKITIARGE